MTSIKVKTSSEAKRDLPETPDLILEVGKKPVEVKPSELLPHPAKVHTDGVLGLEAQQPSPLCIDEDMTEVLGDSKVNSARRSRGKSC